MKHVLQLFNFSSLGEGIMRQNYTQNQNRLIHYHQNFLHFQLYVFDNYLLFHFFFKRFPGKSTKISKNAKKFSKKVEKFDQIVKKMQFYLV